LGWKSLWGNRKGVI